MANLFGGLIFCASSGHSSGPGDLNAFKLINFSAIILGVTRMFERELNTRFGLKDGINDKFSLVKILLNAR